MPIRLLRTALVLLSAVGIWGVGHIVFVHVTGVKPCPTIFTLPAWYVVLLGYSGMLLAQWGKFGSSTYPHKVLFVISWLPVMLVATLGVFGELTGQWRCPVTETGIPKCYISFALAVTLIALHCTILRCFSKLPSA